MNSRERVRRVLNHEKPDRIPFDLGSTSVTGIHVSAYRELKKILGLEPEAIKVIDPYQMLAEVDERVKEKLGVDTYGIQLPYTIFGFKNENWKPWRLFDGTEVLVSGHFEYKVDANGDILLYPGGDRNAHPSAKMPKGGFYFDAIVRQAPADKIDLNPEKWVEQSFSVYTQEDMRNLEKASRSIYEETDYSIVGNFCDGGLGDIGIVPGPNIKEPVGIRDPEEWYIALIKNKDYINSIFGIQTELALKNLKLYHEACENRIDVIDLSETDFGSQRGLLLSREIFNELFKPHFKKMNEWIHGNTNWKIFYHTCGSVCELIDDFIEIGVDILNPVQYSADCMDLSDLKKRYGDKIVFWGGGIDTQRTLPFGNPVDVREEAGNSLKVLGEGSGFVFSAVHNIQVNIPADNLKTLIEVFQDLRNL